MLQGANDQHLFEGLPLVAGFRSGQAHEKCFQQLLVNKRLISDRLILAAGSGRDSLVSAVEADAEFDVDGRQLAEVDTRVVLVATVRAEIDLPVRKQPW